MPEWTKGPWEVADAGSFKQGKYVLEEHFVRRPEDDVSIAQDIIDPDTMKPSLANARLIAAAPDLYEALQRIAYEPCGPADASHRDVLEAITELARAALRKAEGKE